MKIYTSVGAIMVALVLLASTASPQSYTWKGSSWPTASSREEVMQQARSELRELGFTEYLDAGLDNSCYVRPVGGSEYTPRFGYDFPGLEHQSGVLANIVITGIKGIHIDGLDPSREVTTEWVDVFISLSVFPDVFDKGYLCLDPKGMIFWDKTGTQEPDGSFHLHYAYAFDIFETMKYILLYETGHMQFRTTKECADYARRMIYEIRKYHAGEHYDFELIGQRTYMVAQGEPDPDYPFDPFGVFTCHDNNTPPPPQPAPERPRPYRK